MSGVASSGRVWTAFCASWSKWSQATLPFVESRAPPRPLPCLRLASVHLICFISEGTGSEPELGPGQWLPGDGRKAHRCSLHEPG